MKAKNSPRVHSPLFSIQQSELVSVQGNSYQRYYLLGVGVCVLTELNKLTICLRTWDGKAHASTSVLEG